MQALYSLPEYFDYALRRKIHIHPKDIYYREYGKFISNEEAQEREPEYGKYVIANALTLAAQKEEA